MLIQDNHNLLDNGGFVKMWYLFLTDENLIKTKEFSYKEVEDNVNRIVCNASLQPYSFKSSFSAKCAAHRFYKQEEIHPGSRLEDYNPFLVR